MNPDLTVATAPLRADRPGRRRVRLRSQWTATSAAALSAGALVALLIAGVRESGDLAAFDPSVSTAVAAHRTPLLTTLAEAVTTIGSEVSIGVLAALTLLWLVLRRRQLGSAVIFATSMASTGVLTIGLKHLVGRVRPPASLVMGPVDTSFAFPSGHTLFSTVFFGLLAGLVLLHTSSRSARVGAVTLWAVASAAVGLSRVYLGYHWLTDVLAGWTLGILVLALAAASVAALRSPTTRPLAWVARRLGPRSITGGR